MKTKLLFIILTVVGLNLAAQEQQKLSPQALVIGSCVVNAPYKEGEKALFQYNNKYTSEVIDSVNKKTVFNLLLNAGIDSAKILYTEGFGSSIAGRIELFFVYNGTITADADIWVWTGHDRIAGGYAYQNKLSIGELKFINTPALENVCAQIIKAVPLFSFAVKPFNFWWAPYIILATGNRGDLMDMRNINYSNELVEAFKRLKWGRIIYRVGTDPKYKSIFLQSNGTYSNPK